MHSDYYSLCMFADSTIHRDISDESPLNFCVYIGWNSTACIQMINWICFTCVFLESLLPRNRTNKQKDPHGKMGNEEDAGNMCIDLYAWQILKKLTEKCMRRTKHQQSLCQILQGGRFSYLPSSEP